MQDFFNNLNWVMLLKAFVVGVLICIIGQILIDKTKLTPARILVIFVTSGAILRRIRNISTFSRFCRCRCIGRVPRLCGGGRPAHGACDAPSGKYPPV